MNSNRLKILFIFLLSAGLWNGTGAENTGHSGAVSSKGSSLSGDTSYRKFGIQKVVNQKPQFHKISSDTLIVKPVTYSENDFKPYYEDKSFRYGNKPSREMGFWGRLFLRLLQILEPVFSSKITPYVFYTFIFGACAFLLLRFLRGNADKFWQPDISASLQAGEIEEDLMTADIDMLIQNELMLGNYNKAVRLLFLRSIRELGNRHLIHWQKDRTNLDYLVEMGNLPIKQTFNDLVKIYEYAWYGNQKIDEYYFNLIRGRFDNFSRMINE